MTFKKVKYVWKELQHVSSDITKLHGYFLRIGAWLQKFFYCFADFKSVITFISPKFTMIIVLFGPLPIATANTRSMNS